MADYMDTASQLYNEAELLYREEFPDTYNEIFVNTSGKSSDQIARDVEHYKDLVCEHQLEKLGFERTSSKNSLDVQIVESYNEKQSCAEEIEYINNGGGAGFFGTKDKYNEHLNGDDGLYANLEKVRGTDAEATIQARIDELEAVKAEKQAALDKADTAYNQACEALDANSLKQDFWQNYRYGNEDWLRQNMDKVSKVATPSSAVGGSAFGIPKDWNSYGDKTYTASFGAEPKAGTTGVNSSMGLAGVVAGAVVTSATTHTFADSDNLLDIRGKLQKIAEDAGKNRTILNTQLASFKEACAVFDNASQALKNKRTQMVQRIEVQRGGQRALGAACDVLMDIIGFGGASDKTVLGLLNNTDALVAQKFNDYLSSFQGSAESEKAGSSSTAATTASTGGSGNDSTGTGGSGSNAHTGVPGGSGGGSAVNGSADGSKGGTSAASGVVGGAGSVPTGSPKSPTTAQPSADRKVLNNPTEILDFGKDGMSVKNGVIVGGELDGQYYKGKFYRDGNIYEADGAGNEKLLGSYDSMKKDITISTPKGGIVDTPTGYKEGTAGSSGGAAATKDAVDKNLKDLNSTSDELLSEMDDLMSDDKPSGTKPVKDISTSDGGTIKVDKDGTGYKVDADGDITELYDKGDIPDGSTLVREKDGSGYRVDADGDIVEVFDKGDIPANADAVSAEEYEHRGTETLEDVQEISDSREEVIYDDNATVRENPAASSGANDMFGASFERGMHTGFGMHDEPNMNIGTGMSAEFGMTAGFEMSGASDTSAPIVNPYASMQGNPSYSFNSSVLFPEGSAGADWHGESPFTNFDVNHISDSAASALNDAGIHVIGEGVMSGAGSENLVATSSDCGFLSKEQVTWAANVLHQIPGAQFGNVESTTFSIEKGAFIYPINPPADFITALYRF